jgi:bifunctional enzyme CysN/CysC
MSAALRQPLPMLGEAERAGGPLSLSSARSLLRFITCGSVDDGKSTLIGRLLFEAGAVFDDQLDVLDSDSTRLGTTGGARDFALLVDGLAAEREQGITIDVAYRYFSTPRRGFIVADTPGHEQYTRNMATGASTADVAILLVDARKGLLPQTRRHSYIVSAMGVRHVVLAVNKMDLVGFDEKRFRAIVADYERIAAPLGFTHISAIPVCAREGDNLAARSSRLPWYRGPALLSLLETIETGDRGAGGRAFAMPVQWVNRPNADFRGFSGTIAAGLARPGDAVVALPSGRESRVTRIVTADRDLDVAGPGAAVTLVLADDIDVSRGDVLALSHAARGSDRPRTRDAIEARLIITGETRIKSGATFLIKLGTAITGATITAIRDMVDIESYASVEATGLGMNAIGHVTLRFDKPLVLADFTTNAVLGGFVLIDRATNETSAFGFVLPDAPARAAEKTAVARLVASSLGPAGSAQRKRRLELLSWRLFSAMAVAGIVFLFSGRTEFGMIAGLADLALRPLARRLHDKLWRKVQSRQDATLMDGGGI